MVSPGAELPASDCLRACMSSVLGSGVCMTLVTIFVLLMASVKIGIGVEWGGLVALVHDLREMRALAASCSCTADLGMKI